MKSPIAEESGSWSGCIAWRNISLISSEFRDGFNARNGKVIGMYLSSSQLKHPELKYNRLHVGKVFDGY